MRRRRGRRLGGGGFVLAVDQTLDFTLRVAPGSPALRRLLLATLALRSQQARRLGNPCASRRQRERAARRRTPRLRRHHPGRRAVRRRGRRCQRQRRSLSAEGVSPRLGFCRLGVEPIRRQGTPQERRARFGALGPHERLARRRRDHGGRQQRRRRRFPGCGEYLRRLRRHRYGCRKVSVVMMWVMRVVSRRLSRREGEWRWRARRADCRERRRRRCAGERREGDVADRFPARRPEGLCQLVLEPV